MDHDMETINAGLKNLPANLETQLEVPFGPYDGTPASQLGIPRYLFRVFSDKSTGQNDRQWMKSLGATKGNLTDTFDRDGDDIAIALNDHVRGHHSLLPPSPFISWTTSLAVALQYAIYKHKFMGEPMNKIQFCVIDTTDFPNGTFLQDLVLMREFQGRIKDDTVIIISQGSEPWSSGGLPNMLFLRGLKSKDYAGTYYFGEYLAQGQLCIENRSFVESCDKIITKDLLNMIPALKANMTYQTSLWAKAVLQLREPFYSPGKARPISEKDITPIRKIVDVFDGKWKVVMFASLLGLYPRRMEDLEFANVPLGLVPDEILDKCLSQKTAIDTSVHMPEVTQFGQLIEKVSEEYCLRCVNKLRRYIRREADVLARIQEDLDSLKEAHENAQRIMLAVERMERPVKIDQFCTGEIWRKVEMLQVALEHLEL
ncbi:hypothetical protein PFICI_03763 [Pestalotiopsis fici W106-1]|uniref:DUF7587 domain-containing protein n=1 Tax=Pestalotiopsis fici (strain W106-1 / CGMCC3.15140) TaxID=1229662 RepID=W3XI64_PESFW|nr:uncharacterized protein PFICI_03763 [Pestalotiopsis fici W106-1]ETS85738.1 hypothetical protein PFICI_03763 [Pestalotiopsis fici W106-1]